MRHSKPVLNTARWQRLRRAALRRDLWRCVSCNAIGRLEVDHIRPVRTHPELAFSLGNLQSLCASCHSRKTQIERGFVPVDRAARAEWRDLVATLANPTSERNQHA